MRLWMRSPFLFKEVQLGVLIYCKMITTDTSLMGLGAVHQGYPIFGFERVLWHINCLEILEMFLMVKLF